MRNFVNLGSATPVASGHKREIYAHPQDDALLIKVILPSRSQLRWLPLTTFRKFRNWRPGMYNVFHREIGEYICLRAGAAQYTPAIQKIVGLVDTDRGLGMVVEKMTDESGNLAPSLKRLILENGFTPEYRAQVRLLRDELLRCGVVLNKLNTRNILYACSPEHGRRFVIIDGIGRSKRFPLQSWLPAYNRSYTRKQFRRLHREIDRLLRQVPASAPSQIMLAQQ